MRESQVRFLLTLAESPMLHTYTPDALRSEPNCPSASQAAAGSGMLAFESHRLLNGCGLYLQPAS